MRVVIAEDSVLLREGVARLLEDAGFEVVGQCATVEDLLLKVRSYAPDVAIVDIRMPPTHTDEGFRAAEQIRRLKGFSDRRPARGARTTMEENAPPACRLLAFGKAADHL